MRIGVLVLQTRPWEELEGIFRQLEDVGADVAYVADHLSHPTLEGKWLADGWTILAAAAGATTRLELGPLVTSAAVRTPVGLARAAATVHDVSGGRLVLGLGAGTRHDVEVDRRQAATPRDLTRRFAETVQALDALWRGESDFAGSHVGFDHVLTAPLPPGRSRPFLLLAAHGPRAFDLVARHADGWSTYGGPVAGVLPSADFWAAVHEQAAAVTRACEAAGREPASLRRSLLLGYGDDRPLEDVGAFHFFLEKAERAGFHELVVYWPQGEPGTRFWADPEVLVEGIRSLRG